MIAPLISLVLGLQILNYMGTVPEIILKTFKEYPYLYSPTLEKQKDYVEWYANHEQGMLTVAHDHDALCGLVTGIPLEAVRVYVPQINELFRAHNLCVEDYYFCGDVIVLPAYQNQGICSKLFAAFEQQVKTWGYKGISLITSVREENHPLKPHNYKDAELIWQHYGFKKTPIIISDFNPTVIDEQGTVENRENFFVFWVKDLT